LEKQKNTIAEGVVDVFTTKKYKEKMDYLLFILMPSNIIFVKH